jgi:hypothetical protein
VGQDHDGRPAELILLFRVPPAELWLHAEHVTKRRGGGDSRNPARVFTAGQHERRLR